MRDHMSIPSYSWGRMLQTQTHYVASIPFNIFNKIIANRMQRLMKHNKHPQQFCFAKSKGCIEASHVVIQTQSDMPMRTKVISTDFKKAFDSVTHNHIEACLDLYKFPTEFRIAFMRMVNLGTMQFYINSYTSQDLNHLTRTTFLGHFWTIFGYCVFQRSARLKYHYLICSL